ncbi:hypothetical protein [Pedobacter cryoconitis]|uniref:hypothetical protein n=1 Tax=Pedobacter cryoconitis TaxID=188932 RepID=UPI00161BE1E8|nr:hypothetical protein [Pedobacter cryoconitis]MBB5648939.1 hypothetical protein [Pedobacter cryoconitis]
MKNILLVLLLIFLTTCSYGQSKSDFDFIIVIDEAIVTSLSNPKLLIRKENELLSGINISFKPGNLSLNTADYKIIANSNDDLYLKFDYYDYSKGKQEVYNYDIKIGKNWFEKSYLILRIYNTSKKKYKKKLIPIKGTNYAYEIDYGGGAAIQIRKP